MWLQDSPRAQLQTYKTKTHARLMVEKAAPSIAHDDDVCMMYDEDDVCMMMMLDDVV